jgi:hypothetical protein
MPRAGAFAIDRRALVCLILGAVMGCSAESPMKPDGMPLADPLRLASAVRASAGAAAASDYAITKFILDPASFMQGRSFDAVLAHNCEAIRLRKKGQINPCAWGVITGRFRVDPADACYPTEGGLFTLEAICLPTSSEVIKEATAVMQVEPEPTPEPTPPPSPCVVLPCAR